MVVINERLAAIAAPIDPHIGTNINARLTTRSKHNNEPFKFVVNCLVPAKYDDKIIELQNKKLPPA